MKSVMITLVVALAFSPITFANSYGSGSGRTLGPEIHCQLPNGQIQFIPRLYCDVFQGKEVK